MDAHCNNYHALKVAFANEIGAVYAELGADGHAVIDLVGIPELGDVMRPWSSPVRAADAASAAARRA